MKSRDNSDPGLLSIQLSCQSCDSLIDGQQNMQKEVVLALAQVACLSSCLICVSYSL